MLNDIIRNRTMLFLNIKYFVIDNILVAISIMADMERELLSFLENMSSYSGDTFYAFVKEFVGTIESEILEIQRIKTLERYYKYRMSFYFFKLIPKIYWN